MLGEKSGLIRIFYLFLRLAPFIIVCYFILLSIFNKDIKGIIYLTGLMFSALIVKQLADLSLFGSDNKIAVDQDTINNCNLTYLGDDGSRTTSTTWCYGFIFYIGIFSNRYGNT